MTDVGITNIQGYCHIKIQGHAGYGLSNMLPEGNDIVCAAISILGQMAAQCIIELSEKNELGIKELNIEDALIDIKAIPKPAYQKELDMVIWTVKTGFELIAKAHPDYINLGWEK